MKRVGQFVASRPAWVLACSAALGVAVALNLEHPAPDGPVRVVHVAFAERAIAHVEPAAAGRLSSDGPELAHATQVGRALERALESGDPARRETAFNALLPELLAVDPDAATRLWARQPTGEARDLLREELVRQWVIIDRERALDWIGTIDDEADRKAAALVAMRRLGASSPELAIAAADRLGVGRDDGSLDHLVRIWAMEGR
jgi:hypothetical protein